MQRQESRAQLASPHRLQFRRSVGVGSKTLGCGSLTHSPITESAISDTILKARDLLLLRQQCVRQSLDVPGIVVTH